MSDRTTHEKCPHCGESLEYHKDFGYRRARMIHLLDHSLEAALGMPRGALPEEPERKQFLWDVLQTAIGDEDTWDFAAFWVQDEIFDFLDAIALMGYYNDFEKTADKGIAWLKSKYPSALDDLL